MENHNPYSPPSAEVADVTTDAGIVKRPKAVVVMQIIGGVLAVAFAVGVFRDASAMMKAWGTGLPVVVAAVKMTIRLIMLLLLLWMCVGMQRGKSSGRWIGVVILSLMLLAVVGIVFKPPDAQIHGEAYVAGHYLGAALIFLPLALLFYYSAFSPLARAYYANRR